jgi:hypothetical protein
VTIIACVSCDWTGRHYEARDVDAVALRSLEPGSPTPYGQCPQCGHVLPFGKTPAIDGIRKSEWNWRDSRDERANLSKYQRDCLLMILAHLVPDHPGFRASNEIAVALSSTIGSEIPIPDNRAPPFNSLCMAPYLQSWVYPLIVGALYGEVYPGHRMHVAAEADGARSRMEAGQVAA